MPIDGPQHARRGIGAADTSLLRVGIGLLVGAMIAVLGAFMLGEYQFTGALPIAAGVVFGLVVSGVVVTIGRRRSLPVGVLCGVESFGALIGAGWITSSGGLEPIAGGAWLAASLGFAAALGSTVDWQRLRVRR